MNDDKGWDRIVDAIEAKFGIASHGRTKRPIEEGSKLEESVSYITFERGGDWYRLERIQGPAIIDRKTIGARRAGATVHYQNVYDPAETSMRTVAYRQSPSGEWAEVTTDTLGLA